MFKMKIGLFTPIRVSSELGKSKNRLELAEALRSHGWQATVFGPNDLNENPDDRRQQIDDYPSRLREFLWDEEEKLDVALVEADTLPFSREELPPKMLIVARPALVLTHRILADIPRPRYSFAKRAARGMKQALFHRRDERHEKDRENLRKCCNNIDLIQVQNSWDGDALRAEGIRRTPIVVIPNGISKERFRAFANAANEGDRTNRKKIVFVGTFDYRKGCLDLVRMMSMLWVEDPDFRLTLLGTKGLFQSEQDVRRHFPGNSQNRISVVEKFRNDELPTLLASQSIGVFPSYYESFGFGCLEMMASGLPVVAYESPGPESFVPRELLVARGDIDALSSQVRQLSKCADVYSRCRQQCIDASRQFCWESIGAQASEIYHDRLSNKRSNF